MTIYLILIAVSSVGIATIVFRHLSRVRVYSGEEFEQNFAASTAAHHEFLERVIVPVCRGAQNYCVPRFFAISERTARRGRILTLKIETRLHKITNYLQGKRELNNATNGKNSEYWTNVTEHKNGASDEMPEVKA
jgi:hypothetical protein